MSLVPATRLGPYEILGLLGAGGMGEVYRARDLRLGRTVAVKVLPPALSENAESLRRFEQEARTAGALNHPGIVAVHDVGTQDGVAFLVLELLEGETLRAVLDHGPVPVRKAVEYAAQVARGLDAAHSRGIVHRDLKPENLFVTVEGHVKILDFGLAKANRAALAPEQATGSLGFDAVHTEPGVVMGTIGYMSPEQLRGRPADSRSDIFALGAVLYELLAGRRAFARQTAADTISAILGSDPEDLSASERGVAPGLERIVSRCLEKRPEERFQSARDLAFALETPTGASSGSAVAPALAISPPPRRRLGILAAMLAGAAFGSIVVVLARAPATARPVRARFELVLPGGVLPARFPATNSMALSPDGRTLALSATRQGRPMLWLRPIDRLEAVALEGTEGAAGPFWSPDGQMLGFFAGGSLKKTAASGGPPETLAEAAFGQAGTWGSDGTILFTEWAGGREGLYRVSSRGGTPTAIALQSPAGPEVGISWPAFLPDGQRFVYLGGSFGRRPTRTISLATLGSPEARHVAIADSQPIPVAGGQVMFVREGTLLVQSLDAARARFQGETRPVADLVWFMKPSGSAEFTASADGRTLAFRGPPPPSRLAWLDRTGREIEALGVPGIIDGPRLSPGGRRLAFSLADPRAGGRDVWIHDLERGVRSRVTLDPLDGLYPIWGPAGERLLYGSASQGGPLQMRIRNADGSGTDEGLLATNEVQIPQDWSSDGRWILFGDISPARRPPRQLWLLPLDGDGVPRTLESAPVSRYDGRFSPDGRWVAFVSEETGRPEVFVAPLGSGRRHQISSAGGVTPRWREDGRELFYLSPGGRLMAVSLGTGTDLLASPAVELFAVGVAGDAPYDVGARGERFVVNIGSSDPPPIVVTIGWDADPGE